MTFLSALMCGAFGYYVVSRLLVPVVRKGLHDHVRNSLDDDYDEAKKHLDAPRSLQEASARPRRRKRPSSSPNALEGHMDPFLIQQAKLMRICVVMESLVRWKPPDDIEIQVRPYPPLGIVGVLVAHFGVICEVPLGCPCCVHDVLDATVASLIAQADPSEFRERLQDAGRTFEQAIQEIGL